jgi:hypothetical protein
MQTTTNTEETSMTDQQLANLEAELEELDAKPENTRAEADRANSLIFRLGAYHDRREKVAFRRAVREGATR